MVNVRAQLLKLAEELRGNPGKFEGEPEFVVYFYDQMMEGGADEELNDVDSMLYSLFFIKGEDLQKFPELQGMQNIVIWQTEEGFINHQLNVNLDKLREELDEAWNKQEPIQK